MGGVFWLYRRKHLVPATATERQIAIICVGFLLSCVVLVGAARLTAIVMGSELDELTLFPLWSVVSGMAFFIMGSVSWGRCFAFGAAFFAAALLMPFALHWSPLVFGLLWAVALILIGWRLQRLAAEVAPNPTRG
jgi:hypothetical protein